MNIMEKFNGEKIPSWIKFKDELDDVPIGVWEQIKKEYVIVLDKEQMDEAFEKFSKDIIYGTGGHDED